LKWWWQPPLKLPRRADVCDSVATFVRKWGHPRAEVIAAHRVAPLLMFAAEQWDEQLRQDVPRSPTCLWCGMPTTTPCMRVPAGSRVMEFGYRCWSPTCWVCNAMLGGCPKCHVWQGPPIGPSGTGPMLPCFATSPVPGQACLLELQELRIPFGVLPYSWRLVGAAAHMAGSANVRAPYDTVRGRALYDLVLAAHSGDDDSDSSSEFA